MLSEITIENAALIRRARITLSGGFCAVTGQTGAGKTVFVSALGLLKGDKASAKTVSEGQEECRVTGVFTEPEGELMKELAESGLCDEEDDCLTLSRFLKADGKSRCLINGRTVALSLFKSVGSRLISMHSQHETHSLADESTHLRYVDASGDEAHGRLVGEYAEAYSAYRNARKALEEEERRVSEAKSKQIWLRDTVKELSAAALKENEEDRLWEVYRSLEQRGKLSEAAAYVRLALRGTEKQKGAYDRLMLAAARLEGFEEISPDFFHLSERLEAIGYEVEAALDRLEEICPEEGEDAAARMERISDRINKLRRWKKKYGADEKEMLELLEKSREELSRAQEGDRLLEQRKKALRACRKTAEELGARLEESRRVLAEALCRAVDEKLGFLDMEAAAFFVDFVPLEEPAAQGLSTVRFLIRTNAGQSAAPLGSIASGGELSRVMLALKSVLAADKDNALLIFDEVDTGISGKTARKIGFLLREISKKTQIVAVTHSAQIASLADEHFLLKKETADGETLSVALPLGEEERIEELSRILGGLEITDAVRENARELLKK